MTMLALWNRSDRRRPRDARPAARRARGHRLGLEALEPRLALSLGAPFQVNTTPHDADQSANASSANGQSVVVWRDAYSSTDHDIRAQLYDSGGHKLGLEIVVDYSSADENDPKVAMDNSGNFVVTWDRTYSGGNIDVLARRYSNTGAPLGVIFPVASNPAKNEYQPDVASDAAGNFVIAYTLDFSPSDQDVMAQRYFANGTPNGGLISVANSTHNEFQPSVASAPDGRFDIAYTYFYGYDSSVYNYFNQNPDDDVYLNRYSAAGNLLGQTTIAHSTRDEYSPSVSVDNNGNAVVAYSATLSAGGDVFENYFQSDDVEVRRVTNTGALGGVVSIVPGSGGESFDNPSVALNRTTGAFVVAYDDTLDDLIPTWQARVSEVSAANTVLATYTVADANPFFDGPAVSIDGNSNYMLTYTSYSSQANLNHIAGRFGHVS
jgi:hypothetical protein